MKISGNRIKAVLLIWGACSGVMFLLLSLGEVNVGYIKMAVVAVMFGVLGLFFFRDLIRALS